MKNESRRRFMKRLAPATGGWMLAGHFAAFATFFSNIKKATAQLVPVVAARMRKTILIPTISKIFRTKDGFSGASIDLPLLLTSEVTWRDIAWNGSVYCAVGGGASAATSTNLVTWTANQTPFHDGAQRIVTNGSTFLLLPDGATNKIATSPNGVTWTVQTLPVTTVWRDVVWTGSFYCIICETGSIALTSPDAVTWTQRTIPAGSDWYRIVWNGSVLCAVNAGGEVITSPDGSAWTSRAGVPGAQLVDACVSGSSIYVVDFMTTQVHVSSDNGATFTPWGVAGGFAQGLSVVINGATAIVYTGSAVYYTTNSAASWGFAIPNVSGGSFGGSRFINSNFILMGSENGSPYHGCATSTNASTWTGRTMPSAYGSILYTSLAVSGANMCAVSYTRTNSCAYSSDYGKTWSTGTLPATLSWSAVASNGSLLVALSYTSSASAYTSVNGGATWTARTLPATKRWADLRWNGSLFCAISSMSSNVAVTSPDGITWTQRTLPGTFNWTRLLWSGSQFVAIAYGEAVLATSPDGITWTARTIPTDYYSDVCWTGTRFILITAGSKVLTSPDAVTWTAQADIPGFRSLNKIVWNGSAAIAYGYNYTGVTHDLGVTWTTYLRTTPLSNINFGGGAVAVSQ